MEAGVGGGKVWIEERERQGEKTQGESVSINNQVTPGALQLLELPQRGTIVSGIASANL